MSAKIHRRRRSLAVTIIGLVIAFGIFAQAHLAEPDTPTSDNQVKDSSRAVNSDQPLALESLKKLAVKGRAPKTGYARDQFGNGWAKWQKCDTRQRILARDLTNVKLDIDGCTVLSGQLNDPYTGKVIDFKRGPETSNVVQIDHVVALSDAWQTGAQQWDAATRQQLANDDLELLAADGQANMQKSDGDAATWLPPNKSFRCQYVARQIAVKIKYNLWVKAAEHDAMARILNGCPEQRLPAP